MARAATLEIRHLGKQYHVEGKPLPVLDDISLYIRPSEFASIVGASGRGKSTLLRLVIGLDNDYYGELLLDGRCITGTSLERGIVFQEQRLFPWLLVKQNIAFGLLNGKGSDADKSRSVQEHVALVELKGFEKVYPL